MYQRYLSTASGIGLCRSTQTLRRSKHSYIHRATTIFRRLSYLERRIRSTFSRGQGTRFSGGTSLLAIPTWLLTGLSGCNCSLATADLKFYGGRERSRTSDLYSVNVALYP